MILKTIEQLIPTSTKLEPDISDSSLLVDEELPSPSSRVAVNRAGCAGGEARAGPPHSQQRLVPTPTANSAPGSPLDEGGGIAPPPPLSSSRYRHNS